MFETSRQPQRSSSPAWLDNHPVGIGRARSMTNAALRITATNSKREIVIGGRETSKKWRRGVLEDGRKIKLKIRGVQSPVRHFVCKQALSYFEVCFYLASLFGSPWRGLGER